MGKAPTEPVFSQSAVIPYRICDEGIQIALITSRSGKRWIIPKGLIDPGETGPESAAREALEEAGLEGEVGHTLVGTFVYGKWGGRCEVDVYCLRVSEEHEAWLEQAFRKRKWFSVGAAAQKVGQDELSEMIRALPEHLAHELRRAAS